MYRIRLKFAKSGDIRFLSHLEVMRTFERALRRAALPYAVTQGYSPKPKISWGLPLMVGAESNSEYVDLFLKDKVSGEKIIERLNLKLPKGLKVLEAKSIEAKAPSLMSLAAFALYDIVVELEKEVEKEAIKHGLSSFFEKECIKILKKGRERIVNLREAVLDFSLIKVNKERVFFRAKISLSNETISPFYLVELVLSAMNVTPLKTNVCRIELYGKKNCSLTSLMNL